MYLSTKNKIKNLFILLLAVAMAFSMILATACTKDDDGGSGDSGNGNTTTETTLTDYQVLKNGDFEFMTDKDSVYPKSSSIAWSNSLDSGSNGNSAPSTSGYGKSGIIDTLEDGSNSPYAKLDIKYKPGTNAYNPRTPYYYGLVDNKFVDDAESADYEDNKTFVNAKGSKILMIQNKTSNEHILGTAQKFKSSTALKVNADSYAIFSVWVKTMDLKSTFTQNPGAYIAIDFKVGSVTYGTVSFNNINTDGEWALLQAKIQGFEYGSTTAYVTLGLGKGNALGKTGYVEGFAYFDNAHFEVYNKQEFNATSDDVINVGKDNISVEMKDKTYTKNPTEKAETPASNLDKFSTFTYNLNLRQTEALTALPNINGAVTLNTNDSYNNANQIVNDAKIGVSAKGTIPTLTDKFDDFNKIGGTDATSVIYFNFNKFASATYLSDAISLNSNSYNMISFYVKSDVVRLNSDKVIVSVVDYVDENKESATVAFESFTTEDAEEVNYGGWVKYTIMVDNLTDKTAQYKIKITFGPSKNDSKNIFDAYFLQSGYALIADLKAFEISEDLYSISTSDSNLTKVSLKGVYGSYDEEAQEDNSDIYNTTVDGLGKLEISTKPTTNLSEFTRKNCEEGVVSGIINSKYNSNYTGINNLTTFASLTSNNNKYAQAVVLQNNTSKNSALISKSKTLNANSFIKVAIKLNVSEGATANIYLTTNELVNGAYSVANIKTDTWSKELKTTVVGSNSQTWTEVAFYIASGNEDFNYRVEIWLGDRYDEEETKVTGTMFVENVIVSDYDEATFLYSKDLFVDAYQDADGYQAQKHTRAPTTIKETDENGDTITTTKYYNEREIYNAYQYVKFIDYTTLFAENEIDNTVENDDHDHDHEGETEETFGVKTDVALQISSIIIAVVLIAVMIIVLIRTIFKNRKNRKEYVSSFYDRNSREKALKKIKENKSTILLDEDADEEYNYDEAETIEEPAVIDVDALNQNPEGLQEDGGSEDATSEETTEEVVEANEETTNE